MIRSIRFGLRMLSLTNSLISGSETWSPWNGGILSGMINGNNNLMAG